jgi:hypothetical protein
MARTVIYVRRKNTENKTHKTENKTCGTIKQKKKNNNNKVNEL